MKNRYTYIKDILMCAIAFISLNSCEQLDKLVNGLAEENIHDIEKSMEDIAGKKDEDMKTISFNVSENAKILVAKVDITKEASIYDLADSNLVTATVTETVGKYSKREINNPPQIFRIENIGEKTTDSLKMVMLALVDLTLPPDIIEQEQNAVKQIKTYYGKNLYVSFMFGDRTTEDIRATDYVCDNYFRHHDENPPMLYRSIIEKLDEMEEYDGIYAGYDHLGLVILSDGKVYDNGFPIDPQHFLMQQTLISKMEHISNKINIYYVNYNVEDNIEVNVDDDLDMLPTAEEMAENNADNDELLTMSQPDEDSKDSEDLMQMLCNKGHGLKFESFRFEKIFKDIQKWSGHSFADYEITFIQPDGKVFVGNQRQLHLKFNTVKTGEEIINGTIKYHIGSVYDPIIIFGKPIRLIVLGGIFIGIFVLLIVYLIFQLVEPFIRYRSFCNKHLIRYTGSKMSVDGNLVQENCYLCKGNFVEGDMVVAACKHTMHEECWNENGYHCPEYGRRCQHGSHYYNKKNLFDPANALFYMKWVLAAMVAALVAWVLFTIVIHPLSATLHENLFLALEGIKPGTEEAKQYMWDHGSQLKQMPSFGLCMGLCLTFALCCLSVPYRKSNGKRWHEIIFRAVIAGVMGYLSFLLGCGISLALNISGNSFFLDAIPWTLATFVITWTVTHKTHIKVKTLWIALAVVFGLLVMYLWGWIFGVAQRDIRILTLLPFMLYAVSLAVCIAKEAPRSERYFLSMEGPIKPLDVALYKWFIDDPDGVVTIGKSVDCDLQLSWDTEGEIAPISAHIYAEDGSLYLQATDEGVYDNENNMMEEGDKFRLYPGVKFTIGRTTFTFVEKDVNG